MGNVKDFFNKIAKAASAYLDPYGENELKRMEHADKKLELANIQLNKLPERENDFQKQNALIFTHEISHAKEPFKLSPLISAQKKFNIPKPPMNIGILPPDDAPPAIVAPPEVSTAQRVSQVVSVMAEGVQGTVRAPRTARFKR